MKKRCVLWPPAQELKEKHIKNCRLIVNRHELLKYIPKNGVCAEIGIDQCLFTKDIIETTKPLKLHLFDITDRSIGVAKSEYSDEISKEKIVVHLGDSSTNLASLSDDYFDWVYIDGDHSYDGCKKDLWTVRTKMKKGGLFYLMIMCISVHQIF